jgi:predicted phosphohydrolase
LRVLITSDLIFELTGPEPVRRLVAGMDRENPDLVVIAGDIGNPLRHFSEALRCFMKLSCPVAVIPGNHDIWGGEGTSSILLYEETLAETTRSYGYRWLEKEPLLLGNGVAICGSIGWYDYSAKDPARPESRDEIRTLKHRCHPDAVHVDWEYTDDQFAELCRKRLEEQLRALENNDAVSRVLVVTHVPCFDVQLERHADDEEWSVATPFYGHLTMGEMIRKYPKVRWCVSGHTHVGLNGIVEREGAPPIATAVVGSDYAKPRWVTLEV